MFKRRPVLVAYAGFLLFFLYFPLLVLSISSFRGGPTFYHWYRRAFSDPQLLLALRNSIAIGLGTTVFSTLLGTLAALGMRKEQFWGRVFFESLLNLPLVLPEIVMGLAMLVWFVFLNITLGLFSVVLAHTTFTVSYVTLIILARLKGMDPLLEEAAADLGATPWRTFSRVTLPLLLPAVVSGALLAFTLSFDDFLITFFTAGVGSDTLPLRIYSMMRFGVTPEMNAISSAMLFLTLGAVLTVFRLRKD
ncbi:MAG: ABC transporter permease [Deltaproteobacteria bacterium]|nr:ABC transporter permease [Deltaproteobacteria bacterium]